MGSMLSFPAATAHLCAELSTGYQRLSPVLPIRKPECNRALKIIKSGHHHKRPPVWCWKERPEMLRVVSITTTLPKPSGSHALCNYTPFTPGAECHSKGPRPSLHKRSCASDMASRWPEVAEVRARRSGTHEARLHLQAGGPAPSVRRGAILGRTRPAGPPPRSA